MQNLQNLVPNEARTPEERRENARKAGRASGKARRQKKEFKAVLEELLTLPSAELEGLSNMEAICVGMVKKAQQGNVYAAMFVRDTIGQKPTDKVAQEGSISIGWDDEISKVIMEARERADRLREAPVQSIEVKPVRTPGEFRRERAKPDNRIVYSNRETEKPVRKSEPMSFEYTEPTSDLTGTDHRKKLRLAAMVRQQEADEQPQGFGAGYESWVDD